MKHFILFLIFIIAGITLQAQKRVFTQDIGIAPYTFRFSFPHGVEATLDTIAELGFTQIEGGAGDMDPAKFRKLCEARGLSIPSTGVDFDQLSGDLTQLITDAKTLGAKYVVCFWIPHQDPFSLEDANKAIRIFNKAGKTFKENGLQLAYHPHGYEFYPYQDGTLLDHIIRETDPSNLAFEMDIFWIQFGGGDPVALLKKYPDRWKLMHLKDMKKGIETNLRADTDVNNDVALGKGQIDMKNVLKTAHEIGVEYYFIEDESYHYLKQIPVSIRYLQSIKE